MWVPPSRYSAPSYTNQLPGWLENFIDHPLILKRILLPNKPQPRWTIWHSFGGVFQSSRLSARKIHDIQIPQKNEFYTYMYNCFMYVFEFCLIKGALAMIWNDVHWWVESDRRDQHRESTKDLESHLVISRSRSLPFMRIICANVITIIVHCCVLP